MTNRFLTTVAAAAVCLTSVRPLAFSQEQFNRLETNLPGVTTFTAPPAGFDHTTASDYELAMYGLPPRPDEMMEPAAYSSWKRAMRASRERIVPALELSQRSHGPSRAVTNSQSTSGNWSGVVDYSGATSYNHSDSFHLIMMDYVVPAVTQAYGVCNGSVNHSATWIGIDGSGSNDVLQAGTESDAYCGSNGASSSYSAWIEWYPYNEMRITNLPVAPGDDLFIEVWNTSATEGNAYFVNYRTNQAGTIQFSAPPGTTLVGNSAEWVVERPGVSGGLSTLANYVSDYLSNCYATTWNKVSYAPGSSSAMQLTMLDDSGRPISVPTLLGGSAIWLQDTGSAR
jgi:hypothetical protein